MLIASPDIGCCLKLHQGISAADFGAVLKAVKFRATELLIVLQDLDTVAAKRLLNSLAVEQLRLRRAGLQGDGEDGYWDDTGAHWA